MDFMNAMKEELLEDFNESFTENGAVGYRTTGKNLLDLNFAVASLRSRTDREIVEYFEKAYLEDKVLALKWLFFARDVRQGLGERRLFRVALKWVAETDVKCAARLLPLIPEYGRYDDLWQFLENKELCPYVIHMIDDQLSVDLTNLRRGEPISLLAKWLPSINASSAQTKNYAKIILSHLKFTQREYRKLLSKLRSYLDVVERKMSAKCWGDINYEAVPSRANLIYNNAFLRNDEARRRQFLEQLEKGEAKINSSVLYPHDIVHKYTAQDSWGDSITKYDAAIEAMWKGLPDLVQGANNTMVVADGSGSMGVHVGNTQVRALEVANALAIYFAEHAAGVFKNKYITFSNHPQYVDFGNLTSLHDKLQWALHYCECSNTNIEGVFDLILTTAVNNHLSQEEIPANILIISDMEFDWAVCDNDSGRRIKHNLFKIIAQKYAEAGYKLPRLIFWNVNSRTNTIPVRENEYGVALVSGFSVNVCKMVLSGKLDPFECLLETLNTSRYQPVEEALLHIRIF